MQYPAATLTELSGADSLFCFSQYWIALCKQHDQYVAFAQREIERLDFDPSTVSAGEVSSLDDDQLYLHRLHLFLSSTQSQADSLGSQQRQLEQKFSSLAEYLGEDHTCRVSTKIAHTNVFPCTLLDLAMFAVVFCFCHAARANFQRAGAVQERVRAERANRGAQSQAEEAATRSAAAAERTIAAVL
jgi:hypothetical protein